MPVFCGVGILTSFTSTSDSKLPSDLKNIEQNSGLHVSPWKLMNLTVKCFWIHCHIVNCQLRVLVLLGWKTMLPRTFPENGCWWRRKQRFSRFVVPYRISLQKQPFEVIKKTMKSSAACGFVFWTCWLVSSNTRTLIVTSGKLCCGSFYQNSSFQPNIWHGWDLLRVFNARLKVIGILSSRTGIWQISIPALPFFRP